MDHKRARNAFFVSFHFFISFPRLYLYIFKANQCVQQCGILPLQEGRRETFLFFFFPPFFFFLFFSFSYIHGEENSRRIVHGRFVRGRANGFHYRWLVVICGSTGSTKRVGEFTLNARQGRGGRRGRETEKMTNRWSSLGTPTWGHSRMGFLINLCISIRIYVIASAAHQIDSSTTREIKRWCVLITRSWFDSFLPFFVQLSVRVRFDRIAHVSKGKKNRRRYKYNIVTIFYIYIYV